MLKKIIYTLLLSASLLSNSYSQVDRIKGIKYMDSIIAEFHALKEYRKLSYCRRIAYSDSLVCNLPSIDIFYKKYFLMILADISYYCDVKYETGAILKGTYGKSKADYFKLSDEWRRRLKCNKGKLTKRQRKRCCE